MLTDHHYQQLLQSTWMEQVIFLWLSVVRCVCSSIPCFIHNKSIYFLEWLWKDQFDGKIGIWCKDIVSTSCSGHTIFRYCSLMLLFLFNNIFWQVRQLTQAMYNLCYSVLLLKLHERIFIGFLYHFIIIHIDNW